MKKYVKLIGYLGILLSLTICSFFCSTKDAKASEMNTTISVMNSQNTKVTSSDDIPSEIKEPITKGTKLIIFIITAIGGIAALLGLLFLGIAFFGHQPDMKINALLAFGVALLLGVGPRIIDWLVPSLGWF